MSCCQDTKRKMSSRLSELYKKYRLVIGLAAMTAALLLIFAVIYRCNIAGNAAGRFYASTASLNGEQTLVLTDGQTVCQTFAANDAMTSVELYAAGQPDTRPTVGTLTLRLYDSDGNALQVCKLEGEALAEGKLIFPFSQALLGARGKTFTLELTPLFPQGGQLSLYTSVNNVYGQGELTVGGEQTGTDLKFAVYSPMATMVKWMFLAFAVFMTAGAALLYWLALIRRVKLHWLFAVSALILGAAASAIISPYKVADEETHFQTAYRYSNVMLGAATFEVGEGDMMMRACDTARTPLVYSPSGDAAYPKASVSAWGACANGLFAPCGDETMVTVKGANAGNICQYIPAALGISLGRLLHLNTVGVLYLGRLLNLLVFVLLGTLAVRLAPFAKPMFFSVGTLLMTVHQGMSLSYDALINGLAFLFTALCLYLAYEKDIRFTGGVIGLCVTAALLAGAKAGVYIFLVGLLLPVLRRKSMPLKKRWLAAGAVVGSMLLALIVFNLAKVLAVAEETVSPDQTMALSFAFAHPKAFLQMLINSFISLKSWYLGTMLGSSLCWLNMGTEYFYLIVTAILLVLSSMMQTGEKPALRRTDKGMLLAIVIASVLALFLASLTWTPIGSSTIQGIQGRYFLPLLPLLMLVLRTPRIRVQAGFERSLMTAQHLTVMMLLCNCFMAIILF